MKEEFDDYWKTTYDMDGYNKFTSAILPLQNQEIAKFQLLRLPAPLDVLINEYDPSFYSRLEYRDVFSSTRSMQSKIKIIKGYIDDCIADESTLYITDQYLFQGISGSDYATLLIDLLNYVKPHRIVVITSSEYDKMLFDSVRSSLTENKEIKLIISKKIHDRIWITDKLGGFVMGASLNGLARRISCINKLSSIDAFEIYKEIKPLILD